MLFPYSKPKLSGDLRHDSQNVAVLVMEDRKHKAAGARRQALFCLAMAERVSLKDDRDSLREMAKDWFARAEQMEADSE
jgi:hypothetical protein